MVIARVSGQLRKFTNGEDEIELEAVDVKECVINLQKQFPEITAILCDDDGSVLEAIDIYVNGDNIRLSAGLDTLLKDGDEVSFMSAFAAG